MYQNAVTPKATQTIQFCVKRKEELKQDKNKEKKSADQWYDTRYARRKHSLAYYLRS